MLNHIARLVLNAQMSKAPVQAFADRVSAVFVPIIVAISLATMLLWYGCGCLGMFPIATWVPHGHSLFLFALLFGISVLCVACPCALGLATPTAVMVGTGIGADLGVFIKSGAALERGSHVNTVVFDKTGTLTVGKPTVVSHWAAATSLSLRQVQTLVGSLEANSEHPLASALVSWAAAGVASPTHGAASPRQDRSWLLPVADIKQHAGLGISCTLAAADVAAARGPPPAAHPPRPPAAAKPPARTWLAIGSRRLMDELGVPLEGAGVKEWLAQEEGMRRTGLLVACDGTLAACLAVEDPIKAEARGVVARLQQQQVRVAPVGTDQVRSLSLNCVAISRTCATLDVSTRQQQAACALSTPGASGANLPSLAGPCTPPHR